MNNNIPFDLKIVILWTILTDIFVLVPFFNETFLRIIFGWAFVLFFPGYVLIAFLFPEKKDLDFIERIALSVGLSAAITPIIGLFLNFTPFGIRVLPVVIAISFFVLLFTFLSYKKLKKTNFPYSSDFENFKIYEILEKIKPSEKERTLFLLLILSICFFIFTIIFVLTVPKEPEKFTEFYILNEEGNANWYPANLTYGDKGIVNIYVVNHEYQKVNYKLIIKLDNEILKTEKIFIDNNETWNEKFVFTAEWNGTKKMEFLLYKQDVEYRKLHLWINVK